MTTILFDGGHYIGELEVRWGFVVYNVAGDLMYQGSGREWIDAVAVNSMLAEMVALEKAMLWAADGHKRDRVAFLSDNAVLVKLMHGQSKAHARSSYKKLYDVLKECAAQCPNWTFWWISRRENGVADHLCKHPEFHLFAHMRRHWRWRGLKLK